MNHLFFSRLAATHAPDRPARVHRATSVPQAKLGDDLHPTHLLTTMKICLTVGASPQTNQMFVSPTLFSVLLVRLVLYAAAVILDSSIQQLIFYVIPAVRPS